MKLRVFGFLLLALIIIPAAGCAVTDVTITPSSPEQGDTVKIIVQAGSDEQVSMEIKYSGDVPVSAGKYKIALDDVVVPSGPNSVYAKTTGVETLVVAVELLPGFWPAETKTASDGIAIISHSNIPSGTFNLEVKGKALPGETSISLSFTAVVTLTMDSNGEYTYSYKTSNIPPGTIKVDVAGIKETITLSAPSGGSSGGVTIPLEPEADFSIDGDRVVGSLLSFDGGSSEPTYGSITGYSWSFGDGSSGSGETVSHVYGESGEYTVKLTVTNSVGLTDDKTVRVTIDEDPNLPPVSKPGSDRSCFTGQLIDFSSRSVDPDGEVVRYLWDFDDGVTGAGRSVSHSWDSSGIFYVNHTVVDDRGVSTTAFVTVAVEEIIVGTSFLKNVTVEGPFFQHFGDLGASIRASGNGTRFYLFGYDENPHPGAVLPEAQTGGIVDLVVSNPDGVEWPIYFEMEYDGEGVSDVVESSFGLYFYSGGAWSRCAQTGVDIGLGIVWANLTASELTGSPLTVGMVSPLPYFEYSGLGLENESVEEVGQAVAGFTLSNTGEKAGNVVTLVYLDGEPIASKTLHLEPGEVSEQVIGFAAPVRGEYIVQVDDMVVDLIVTPPTVPDLAGSLSITPVEVEAGEEVALGYGVSNVGNRTAGGFTCSLVIDGLVVSSTRVDSIGAGETVSFEYVFSPSRSGTYPISYLVDVDDDVVEIDEGNNVAGGSVESVDPFNYGLLTAFLFLVIVVGFYLVGTGKINI